MSASVSDKEKLLSWLLDTAMDDATGRSVSESPSRPTDWIWLGRLAALDEDWLVRMGERGRRLDPPSMGFRFRPTKWEWRVEVKLRVWYSEGTGDDKKWIKSEEIAVVGDVAIPNIIGTHAFLAKEFAAAFTAAGFKGRTASLEVEVEASSDGDDLECAAMIVNTTGSVRGEDSNLYQVELAISVGDVVPMMLDALPDSFRYDRAVDAFGLYCGVTYDDRVLRTTDYSAADRSRPEYWSLEDVDEPDLAFATLASNPVSPLRELCAALSEWGDRAWSDARLDALAEEKSWSAEMRGEAAGEQAKFEAEVESLRVGIDLIESDEQVRTAFTLMNASFARIAEGGGGFDAWRPFQIAFVVRTLPGLIGGDEQELVEALWFATGGGKTETYLGNALFACFYDRLRGKQSGITAWSKFPLRMLSLQQTQRFADALAAAEIIRRDKSIVGAPFALGFLVGQGGTPNAVKKDAAEGAPNADEPDIASRNRILLHCPFCRSVDLKMRFNRRVWRLEHRCANEECPWPDEALPFYCVDQEVYRFLPSIVLGTLDKAASVSLQAAMRGVYDAPLGRCSEPGHGYTYMPRSKTPNGCLVPDCIGKPEVLNQAREFFGMSLRIQDELHMLRDNLGAIDSHYETAIDSLQRETTGTTSKVIASSATLAGFENQTRQLYARDGRVFPLLGPQRGESFWTSESEDLMRRFVGLAPRGQTMEFANERLAASLQRAIRRLISDPVDTCAEIGIQREIADELLGDYGTHVVYGIKLREVEAAARSFESQPGVTPLNVEQLTGQTPLTTVQSTLDRLGAPEADFNNRLHIICASSMMSHGVDVDRFNVITMLGIPLATAEFIQATARIGRKHPGLVFVFHRMGTERDASVFRTFPAYVSQGDRFVEPVAITRRSKKVLDKTFPGLYMARVLGVEERARFGMTSKRLTTASDMREWAQDTPGFEDKLFIAICDELAVDPSGNDPLVAEAKRLVRETVRRINDPASDAKWVSETAPGRPMISLRDIEPQIEVYSKGSE